MSLAIMVSGNDDTQNKVSVSVSAIMGSLMVIVGGLRTALKCVIVVFIYNIYLSLNV